MPITTKEKNEIKIRVEALVKREKDVILGVNLRESAKGNLEFYLDSLVEPEEGANEEAAS